MSHEDPLNSLQQLRNALDALRGGRSDVAALCRTWRGQSALLQSLPPRYEQVAEDLLGRLEAGSLFSEESCSFSQGDLLNSLDTWLDKAQQTVAAA
jgi:hypothetical protein